jgi:hypothetical protein
LGTAGRKRRQQTTPTYDHRATSRLHQLRDEHHVDLAGLGKRKDLLAFGAVVFGAGAVSFQTPTAL